MKSGRNMNIQTTQGFRLQAQTVDISVSGQWTESTKNKREVTTEHYMDAKTQTMVGYEEIWLDGGTVNIDGTRIDLN